MAPDGRVDAIYYDRRRDPENISNEVSLQSSFDGGRSFSARVPISQRSFDSRVGFGSERDLADLGSCLGLISTPTGTLAVWPDTRSGSEISGKQDIASAVIGFSEPARLNDGLKSVLLYGGGLLGLGGLIVVGGALRRERAAAA